ncbi:competence protein ComEC [Nitrosomonas sp. PY1]|uniref:DNA internalization-related competence protein ComEC/Rec2 n=1 Tax=Nitrosomonas sp. PY1 TaxID=1803906 RepID=UPI001FC8C7AC|nr:DNA internalization-related competence protein ComEC/Rec2 [Nitrosomonas sp. PY1]GKS69423.1 competence protein ComEC [Nitrosomonas sp. PY1]
MLTRNKLLAFVLGAGLLQLQAELLSLQWLWILLPVTLLCIGLWQYSNESAALIRLKQVMLWFIFFALGFFWATSYAHWRLADSLPAEWERKDIQVIGVIASLPQRHTHSVRFKFDIEHTLTEGAYVPKHISLSWYAHQESPSDIVTLSQLKAGQRWQLTIRVKQPHGNANPHGYDYEAWALEHNIRATGYVRSSTFNKLLQSIVHHPKYWIEHLREAIQQRFEERLPNSPYVGILQTLATGDQSVIARDQWEALTRTGTVHLMAISGLHVTLVSGLTFALMLALWRRNTYLSLYLPARKAAIAGGLLVALGYVLLSGFAIPAQRAFWMLFAVAVAVWRGHMISPVTVLLWALFLVVLWDPWAIQSTSFWLSFGAIAIILWITVNRLDAIQGWKQWFRIQWAITLGLMPLLLGLFQQFSLVSPLANLIAIPFMSLVVIPLTLLSTLPLLDQILLPLAHAVLSFGMTLIQWLSDIPDVMWQQYMPPLWAIFVAMIGIIWMLLPGSIGLYWFNGFPARWLGLIALLPLFTTPPSKPRNGELWLTVLDVGQGLSVVVRTANHNLLFDTGPNFGEADSGSRIIVPYLRGEGIHQLDTLVISHADSDHSGGVLSVIKAIDVKAITSSLEIGHPLQQQFPDHARCSNGTIWEWDNVQFEWLHPSITAYNKVTGKTNDRSCVLKITSSHGSVLLPSDIGFKEEHALLNHFSEKLPATVLIAPHHGSNSSSSATFIRTVNPKLAIFPVGYQNRYSHPHPDVLMRYLNENIPSFRSDIHGAVLIRFADNHHSVDHWRALHKRYWHHIQ